MRRGTRHDTRGLLACCTARSPVRRSATPPLDPLAGLRLRAAVARSRCPNARRRCRRLPIRFSRCLRWSRTIRGLNRPHTSPAGPRSQNDVSFDIGASDTAWYAEIFRCEICIKPSAARSCSKASISQPCRAVGAKVTLQDPVLQASTRADARRHARRHHGKQRSKLLAGQPRARLVIRTSSRAPPRWCAEALRSEPALQVTDEPVLAWRAALNPRRRSSCRPPERPARALAIRPSARPGASLSTCASACCLRQAKWRRCRTGHPRGGGVARSVAASQSRGVRAGCCRQYSE